MWHHAPEHWFVAGANYMVTAGTLHKTHYFNNAARLARLQELLVDAYTQHGWELHAWAVFCNHYHCVARAPDNAVTLAALTQQLHSATARAINREDNTPGRKVWHEYWDTCLTYERSYYARLNYVMQNAVKHGLVPLAEHYPYCSAAWFALRTPAALQKKIASFGCDRVNVNDDYECAQ
jgi:putative transposase